ncbi:ZIP zinc transporter-domain-containing protein [Syncephalastrum racemosum]|uniref:ZIP zinc transporter-domain-containing protein n=1 Tax=Syncephalastrum racemosum TaxID=13706 RepID=A0A1X2HFE9_SYNRA|nr:ZIP zinc transporter-domain-containing protein [Syncephalastrum racemosum]
MGREEWAVPAAIATPGEWEVVTKKKDTEAEEEPSANKRKYTSHDDKPEFEEPEAEDQEDLRNFKIKEKEYPTDMHHHEDNENSSTAQGWLLVLVSSIACILGASIVFIDIFWPQSHGSILDNKPFLSGSMALASGVLLFSSLAILLPESQERLGSAWKTYACFFAGSLFTLLLTRLIHWCAPSAIHACGGSPHHHAQDANNDVESGNGNTQERQPLLRHCNVEYGTSPNREAHIRFHPPHQHQEERQRQQHQSEQHQHQHQHATHKHQQDHGEHDFLRIGIQTAVAIGVHKFPEGLILFVSSQASEQLGWSIAAAMSIHNLTEGFMISLPLYFALRSRTTAFWAAALLGGLSQPIGAVIGLALLRNIDSDQENLMFGITFGLSMLPQAIKADTTHRYVLFWFFLGIFLVGLTSVLEAI